MNNRLVKRIETVERNARSQEHALTPEEADAIVRDSEDEYLRTGMVRAHLDSIGILSREAQAQLIAPDMAPPSVVIWVDAREA